MIFVQIIFLGLLLWSGKTISEFQNEAKYNNVLVKMAFICTNLAVSLALKQRLGAIREWPFGRSPSCFWPVDLSSFLDLF